MTRDGKLLLEKQATATEFFGKGLEVVQSFGGERENWR